jgi:hypothetical protein
MENITIDLNQEYLIARVSKYPSVAVQLDMLYWDAKNGTNKWVEMIDQIKTENPKPQTEGQ